MKNKKHPLLECNCGRLVPANLKARHLESNHLFWHHRTQDNTLRYHSESPVISLAKCHNDLAETIQRARGKNYSIHYDLRGVVKSMPADLVREFDELAGDCLPFPLLNLFGAPFADWIPVQVDQLLKKMWTPALIQIFNPWYLSDEGWIGFQRLWTSLPEPEDLPLELWISTHKAVDNSQKTVDNLWKTCGDLTDNSASYPQIGIQSVYNSPKFEKLSTACGQIPKLSTALSTAILSAV